MYRFVSNIYFMSMWRNCVGHFTLDAHASRPLTCDVMFCFPDSRCTCRQISCLSSLRWRSWRVLCGPPWRWNAWETTWWSKPSPLITGASSTSLYLHPLARQGTPTGFWVNKDSHSDSPSCDTSDLSVRPPQRSQSAKLIGVLWPRWSERQLESVPGAVINLSTVCPVYILGMDFWSPLYSCSCRNTSRCSAYWKDSHVSVRFLWLSMIDLRTAQVYCDWIFLVSQEVYLNFHNFCV